MAEPFVPDDFEVPSELWRPGMRLEPLGPEHNERDHEAWSSSIDHIRATRGFRESDVDDDGDAPWPRPMSLEENLGDLERHAADFLARWSLGMRRASRCSIGRLDLTIYEYSSACYYERVYIQGGNLLDDLRRRIGDTAFWKGLRAYVDAQRWQLAPPRALVDALDAATPLSLMPRVAQRFPRWY